MSHFITGHAAVLMTGYRHHAFQVQFCHLPFFRMISMETIVQTGEHLLPLVLQSLIFTPEHPQGQHDKEHQDQPTSYRNSNHSCPEPQFF